MNIDMRQRRVEYTPGRHMRILMSELHDEFEETTFPVSVLDARDEAYPSVEIHFISVSHCKEGFEPSRFALSPSLAFFN